MSLEQPFQISPEQFQKNLAKLSLERRFSVVEKLSESEKQRLSINVNYTDDTQTFVIIPRDKGRDNDIYIITDPLDYNESKADEARLLPMWRSEQAVYQEWGQQFITPIIERKLQSGEQLTAVDVGCGSGVSALWLQSFCSTKLDLKIRNVGIDLSPRAITASDKNARLNGWNEEATENFEMQLKIAMSHLASSGVILINQMLPMERDTGETWLEKYFGSCADINVNISMYIHQ